MSAVERIQAAIDKLDKLKADSTPGPWWGHQNILGVTRVRSLTLPVVAEVYGDDEQFSGSTDTNTELIVTLHRTIDAQLAILQFGIKRQEAVDWTARVAGDKHREAASLELALADAILGAQS